jgi:hypothetical protein
MATGFLKLAGTDVVVLHLPSFLCSPLAIKRSMPAPSRDEIFARRSRKRIRLIYDFRDIQRSGWRIRVEASRQQAKSDEGSKTAPLRRKRAC